MQLYCICRRVRYTTRHWPPAVRPPPSEDRSESDCLWLFRSLVTCAVAGLHGAGTVDGQVALVAGASKGIGAATAEAFAAAGAAVVLGSRDTAALGAVASRISSRGGRVLATYLDVTDADSMRQVVDQALSMFGRLDAAFNNASAGPLPTPLADIDPADFDLGIATNIRGTFLGMKFQIPAMLRSGGGAIVNMASIAGLNGTANLAAYVAGKAGIIGLTKVAALDYADQGIRVNVVAPGPILTYHLEAAGPQAQQGAAMSTPMRRVGRPAEVAQVVLWLCSEQSSFVTGTVVPIDGGPGNPRKEPPSRAWCSNAYARFRVCAPPQRSISFLTMAAREAAESRSQAIREIQMNRSRSSGKLALRPVSSRLSESRSCAAATSPLPTSRARPALPSSMRSPLRNCSQTPTRSACKSLSR